MKKRSAKQNQTIKALDSLYKENNAEKIAIVEKMLLPKEIKLPKDLKAIYDNFKDNPLDGVEKDIYEAETNSERLKIALDSKIDEFSSMDSTLFIAQLSEKISAFKDDDGFYKQIPSLVAIGIPTNTQLAEVQEAIKPISEKILKYTEKAMTLVNKQVEDAKKYREIIDSGDEDNEALPEIIENIANFAKKQEALNKKTQDLDKEIKKAMLSAIVEDTENMSSWEQEIMSSFINDYVVAINTHTMQNPADFSPFAKFIKN